MRADYILRSQIIIFPLRLNVNQRGITVDQLIERRKVVPPGPCRPAPP